MLGDQVVISPNFATAMFGFNVAKPPFVENPKLRLALNIALDRDIFVKYVSAVSESRLITSCRRSMGYDPAIPEWAQMSPTTRATRLHASSISRPDTPTAIPWKPCSRIRARDLKFGD